jgi:hypothetical protein
MDILITVIQMYIDKELYGRKHVRWYTADLTWKCQ